MPSYISAYSRIDDEIYDDLISTFGKDLKIDVLDEAKDFKSPEMKEKWRNFINKYEGGRVTDYNFGSLVRIDASKDYTEENTMFGTLTPKHERKQGTRKEYRGKYIGVKEAKTCSLLYGNMADE